MNVAKILLKSKGIQKFMKFLDTENDKHSREGGKIKYLPIT